MKAAEANTTFTDAIPAMFKALNESAQSAREVAEVVASNSHCVAENFGDTCDYRNVCLFG